ncbi:Blp family class II bacteriocin [Mongoliitalea lutea]|uniref:Uncharacterized protein n=1 Tax=Mongoliitalea lutea TaxID=849756 RepID=A0A8J3CXR3_9BACT|nr:Blp family class II bacteriocin [Mongoliitalea lutea]GHB45501.1 hypothetical protein GCM10008106_28130 [Mongoliitalea lutea]
MKELSIDRMEMVSGGLFSQICKSDADYFFLGSVAAGIICGGGVGYAVGLAIGGIGGDLVRKYAKDC